MDRASGSSIELFRKVMGYWREAGADHTAGGPRVGSHIGDRYASVVPPESPNAVEGVPFYAFNSLGLGA